jgi:hypothetical protein
LEREKFRIQESSFESVTCSPTLEANRHEKLRYFRRDLEIKVKLLKSLVLRIFKSTDAKLRLFRQNLEICVSYYIIPIN